MASILLRQSLTQNLRYYSVLVAYHRAPAMNVISVDQERFDLDGDEGADIPDIPLRRRPNHSRRPSADLGLKTAMTLDNIIAGTRDLNMEPAIASPISHSGLRHGENQHRGGLGTSIKSPPSTRVRSPEPDVFTMGTQSPPPSTYQPSILSSRSKAASTASTYLNTAISLAALQTKAGDDDAALEPLQEEDVEPGSFDLVGPAVGEAGLYSLEKRSELLFSKEHLQTIFDDPIILQRFTTFLCGQRPSSLPLLIYYLDALKAVKAVEYSNAIIEALEPIPGHDFTGHEVMATMNESLRQRADAAFEALARDDLPAYITHVWIQTVSISIRKRITGTLPPHLREMSEGLAEVFCLTDPSRHDNPIVFASEEFHRTTQYGMNYVLGRNCRFLQGPKTNPFSVKRIKEKVLAGKEHYETFLNYRRDGSPFMNLLMVAPLYDSRGAVRYFIGAQVDVSGLAKDCVGLESLRRLVDETEEKDKNKSDEAAPQVEKKEEIRQLCEMFNLQELETVRKHGGALHRLHTHQEHLQASDATQTQNWHKPRVLIRDEASSIGGGESQDPLDDLDDLDDGDLVRKDGKAATSGNGVSAASAVPHSAPPPSPSGRLTGIFENYLLVRPYPNLKILFASPSLRVPGILQSHFMSKIGGSSRVRDELTAALAEGHGVTAKVRWVASAKTGEGRHRWIHCTPLLGGNGAIGVWMVIITEDEEGVAGVSGARRTRDAPPVDLGDGPGSSHKRNTRKTFTSGLYGDDVYVGPESRSASVAMPFRHANGSMISGTRSSSPYTLKIGEE
ncbi:hypothetical protein PpBr36_02427 [Pyricularia pennisetigena]|uniref:hypothetical protein n=1 Tax=Pyricularia pennisetigena TaxID=1578925 RepID=UPI0011539447|nr:hypothetical protein PpBr36_02427 [Pyricularia pennisetigena]TLS30335.1 hypothetical protein PpBr36_02427 [Pyricularia pennisetigena]